MGKIVRNLKRQALFFLVSLLLTSLIFPVATVFADPPGTMASRFTPEEAARSYLYYGALSKCFKERELSSGFNDDLIKESDAKIGKWLSGGAGVFENPSIGYFLTGSGSSVTVDNDTVGCSNPEWILDAINLWGYTDPIQALCDFGAKRRDGSTECVNRLGVDFTGNDERTWGWGSTALYRGIKFTTFQDAVKNKVYGSQDPKLTPEATYILQLNAFNAGCLGSSSPSVYTGSATDEFLYKISQVDYGTGKITKDVKFYGKLAKNDSIKYMTSTSSLSNISMTCGELAESLEKYVDEYSQYIRDLLDAGGTVAPPGGSSSAGTGATVTPTCGSVITTGIGWIVCPVIGTLTTLNDSMWSFVENLLFVNPISQSNDGVYKGWVTIRNISNVFFVIAFLVIIFSQLSGFGVSNYGVKKLLPRIIVVAIAINLSFIVMQVAIDATNIIGKGLYDAIYTSSPTPTIGWADALKLVLEGSGIALGAGAAGAAALVILGPEAALLALLPILLAALVSFLAAVLTLIFRQAIIPILAMIAPLAFIANLLPNTEQWFKKWSKLLLNMLMLYPMAALVFAGARFASSAIIGEAVKQGNTFDIIIGLIVLSLPLFSLPFLSRQGAPMLAKVSGALGSLGKRITSPIDNFSKELSKEARVRGDNAAMNAQNPKRLTRLRQRYLRSSADRKAILGSQESELNRGTADYISEKAINDADFRNKMAAGGGSGADSRAQARAIKAQDDIFKSEQEAEAILLRNLTRDKIIERAKGGAGITEAQQAAAFDKIMQTGNLEEREQMYGSLTPATSQRIKAIAENNYYARGDSKIFNPKLGDTIKAGEGAGGTTVKQALEAQFTENLSNGSFSAAALSNDEKVATRIKDRIKEVTDDASRKALAAQAQAALSLPTSVDLGKDHRAALQAIIDAAAGAGGSSLIITDRNGNPQ